MALEVRAHRALLPQSLRSWPSPTSSRITACMEVVLTYPSQKLVKTEVAATVVLAVLVQGDHHPRPSLQSWHRSHGELEVLEIAAMSAVGVVHGNCAATSAVGVVHGAGGAGGASPACFAATIAAVMAV